MRLRVRRARPDDAEAIVTIARDSLGDTLNQARIRRLLSRDSHCTLVAEESEEALGFADSFITRSAQNEARMELDLLAVASAARGQGIGRLLLAESAALAQTLDVRLIRALVRASNQAMQSLCSSLAFVQSENSFELFVASPRDMPTPANGAEQAHLIRVQTLAYSGIWMEGVVQQEDIAMALSWANQERLSTVGALVSPDDAGLFSILRNNAFRPVGAYDWWSLCLENG